MSFEEKCRKTKITMRKEKNSYLILHCKAIVNFVGYIILISALELIILQMNFFVTEQTANTHTKHLTFLYSPGAQYCCRILSQTSTHNRRTIQP